MKASRPRQGSILIITAMGILFVSWLVSAVTDLGWIYLNHSRLEKAVRAAWQVGYDEMTRQGGDHAAGLSEADKARIQAKVLNLIRASCPEARNRGRIQAWFGTGDRLVVKGTWRFGLFFARALTVGAGVRPSAAIEIALLSR